MDERRRSKRSELKSKIMIKRLDSGEAEEVDIEILDVSRSGVGFICSQELEKDAVYESHLTIWTKEVLHTLLQIVRIEKKGEEYHYGAVFMGMSETDASRIEVYQTVNENEE